MVREFFLRSIIWRRNEPSSATDVRKQQSPISLKGAFKAFAKALDEATGYDPRLTDVLSTKGSL
mgnify:CR=1 FL=1